jgi:hypothetical protein
MPSRVKARTPIGVEMASLVQYMKISPTFCKYLDIEVEIIVLGIYRSKMRTES